MTDPTAGEPRLAWCTPCDEAHPSCVGPPSNPTAGERDGREAMTPEGRDLVRRVEKAEGLRFTINADASEPKPDPTAGERCPHYDGPLNECGICTGCDA